MAKRMLEAGCFSGMMMVCDVRNIGWLCSKHGENWVML